MSEVIEKVRLKFERIKPKVGARILNSKEEILSGEISDEIRGLLEEVGVLVFPKIDFTDEEQVAFTNSVGGTAQEMRGESVFKISLDRNVNKEAVEYLKGSLFWHVDGTMNRMPIRGSVLSSKVLPTWGGNTEFANCYTAYEDLSQETKDRLENLRVIHSMWNSQLYHCPEPTLAQLEDWMSKGEEGKGERELPLVYKHASGRKSLILGNTAERVVGLSARESAKLLHGLREHATSEPYHYAHEWSLGDAVMWDNTGTLHRAMPYDPDCGRMLHRTIIKGDSWG
ncbi:taurine catabolism dioxygenase [Novosphingobium endophyticum]|uniref:Taurine catabolism dioxygenase n=1 Tax=Novosphingobium endophyticum TaxID=1955250 RepID=A0A916TVH2_9SPHN|nr:TauD/TfdA family dioxygenase [Novosphingobium endophyticum]GGC14130.1 taurine catabolism dioxygenase [Novosphingobium endophyticum]